MAVSDWYDHSTVPSTGAALSSSTMRAEFDAVENGLSAKLPDVAGAGGKIIAVNAGATALESITTTGTGSGVRATSPTLVTPVLGAATATSINKVILTAPATVATLTIAEGKTLTVSNTITLAGTDATVMTFPTTSATIARTDAGNNFTGAQTITANSASDGLRVTQTGAGNAFVVEDVANPDSTPFVIDTSGKAVFGYTTALIGQGGISHNVQIIGTAAGANLHISRIQESTSGGNVILAKARGAAENTPATVAAADGLGSILLAGHDGTNYVTGVEITAVVASTPSTGIVPAYLRIRTAGSDGVLTERLRIDSGGAIGQNGAGTASIGYRNIHTPTGATTGAGFSFTGAFQSDMTSTAASYIANPATAAATYTLATLDGFQATTTTVGIDSQITNYHAFRAANIQPAATLNTAFSGQLTEAASTTFTITAVERTANVATITVSAAHNLSRNTSITVAAVTNTGVNGTVTITAVPSTTRFSYASVGGDIAPGADTGTVTFGGGKWNAYMSGSAPNYFAGQVIIGSTGIAAGRMLEIRKAATGSTTTIGFASNSAVQSDSTVAHQCFGTFPTTQAAAFTIDNFIHYATGFSTVGSGSAITTHTGFQAAAQIGTSGAPTTAYGFRSLIASGTGKWSLYMDGTAANYLNGDLRIGTTTQSGSAKLTVAGDALITSGSLGYATGSGGAVTQATSRTTGVTLNKSNGAITLVSAAGTTTWQTFTVTNSLVAATDVVHICQKSGTDLNEIHVTAVGAGSFNVSFRTTGGVTVEQPVFNFAVIKAVAA